MAMSESVSLVKMSSSISHSIEKEALAREVKATPSSNGLIAWSGRWLPVVTARKTKSSIGNQDMKRPAQV